MHRFVLSCDGGGIRGIATVQMLKRFDSELKSMGVCISDLDFVCGTSTGGIITLMLCRPNASLSSSIEELEDFYLNGMKDLVFSRRRDDGLYDSRLLAQYAQLRFKDLRLSDSYPPVGVTVYRVDTATVHVLSRWTEPDMLYSTAVLGTTAAQGAFDPVKHKNMIFADGGVAANNPVLWAYCHVKEHLPDTDKISVLSLSTLWQPHVMDDDSVRQLSTSQMWTADYVASNIPDLEYGRVYMLTGEKQIRMDDCSPKSMKDLIKYGNEAVDRNMDKVKAFCESLAQNKGK